MESRFQITNGVEPNALVPLPVLFLFCIFFNRAFERNSVVVSAFRRTLVFLLCSRIRIIFSHGNYFKL